MVQARLPLTPHFIGEVRWVGHEARKAWSRTASLAQIIWAGAKSNAKKNDDTRLTVLVRSRGAGKR